MPRWEPDAVGRLQNAAIELFDVQGFERTTVAEIALRAGLTERTFFNYFADKREVFFGPRSVRLQDLVVQSILHAPTDLPPLDVVVNGFQVAAKELEKLRTAAVRRSAIIAATPELQERDDAKRSSLTRAIATALETRGLESAVALLTARAGALVEQTATQRWTAAPDSRPLCDLLTQALCALRSVAAERER